jgi:hypothetical protein
MSSTLSWRGLGAAIWTSPQEMTWIPPLSLQGLPASLPHSFFNPACSTTFAHFTRSFATSSLVCAGLINNGIAAISA